MDFEFSDDQKQLGAEARRFLEAKCPPARCARCWRAAAYDAALWKGLAEMGFLGVVIPEQYGGLGARLSGALRRRRGDGPRAGAGAVFVVGVLATEFLLAAGIEAQKQAWLPKLASGAAIGTLRLVRGKGNPVAQGDQARRVRRRLNGTKKPVPDGDIADFAIVAARTGRLRARGYLAVPGRPEGRGVSRR
jgi:alkylation response protein AidB-like acyl-CoA dehydrogenase